MNKKRVFISFDYDNDLDIKNSLVAQSKNPDSPFEIKDLSIKEAIDEKWKEAARRKIKSCDCVIILCGRHTDTAKGVTAELTITQEENIPYFCLSGHKGESIKPKGAKTSDILYPWTWSNIKSLLNGKR